MNRNSSKSMPTDRALKVQGDSVRATWAQPHPTERRPLRRDPPPAPPPLIPTEDELRLRLAEELDYARRMLTVMGDDLAGNPALVMRHTASLQSIDIVGQILGHIATVVRTDDTMAAVDRIGMAELKARLTRRSIG